MNFSVDNSIDMLSRTPSMLNAWLGDLSDDWLYSNEGEYTWHPIQVVIHLILAETTNWLPRMQIVLSENSSKAFNTFNRTDEDNLYSGKCLVELLSIFKSLRTTSVEIIRSNRLTESDLSRTGLHPVLGEVNLKQLLAAWTVHDLNHIAQLSRVLAFQYAAEVGPWVQYLSVLKKPVK